MYVCIIHGFAPTALTEIFSSASVVRPHDYNLRNSDMKLNLPFPKTEYLKKSISFNGVKLWNDLPIEVRNAESLGIFNSLLCATTVACHDLLVCKYLTLYIRVLLFIMCFNFFHHAPLGNQFVLKGLACFYLTLPYLRPRTSRRHNCS